MGISMEIVYGELKELRKEVSVIRYALIQEEKVSSEELEEIIGIEKEMEKGERVKLENEDNRCGGCLSSKNLRLQGYL
jgi:hypothetical protein